MSHSYSPVLALGRRLRRVQKAQSFPLEPVVAFLKAGSCCHSSSTSLLWQGPLITLSCGTSSFAKAKEHFVHFSLHFRLKQKVDSKARWGIIKFPLSETQPVEKWWYIVNVDQEESLLCRITDSWLLMPKAIRKERLLEIKGSSSSCWKKAGTKFFFRHKDSREISASSLCQWMNYTFLLNSI